MAGINRVILIGNLGQDPELRYTQAGQAVMTMRLATTESFLGSDKERQERTEWHSVVLWGKRAEGLSKILRKGSQLCIEGRLQTRSWEAQDGSKRYRTEVVATQTTLLGRKPSDEHSEAPAQGSEPPAAGDDFGDEDIQF